MTCLTPKGEFINKKGQKITWERDAEDPARVNLLVDGEPMNWPEILSSVKPKGE